MRAIAMLLVTMSMPMHIWAQCDAYPGPMYPAPIGSTSDLAVCDVNFDGTVDALVTSWDEPELAVLINRMGRYVFSETYATGVNPNAIAHGDLDRDGFVDVVVANRGDDFMTWLNGSADGEFSVGQPIPIPFAFDVAIADIDGDGWLDVVGVGPVANVTIGFSDGQGGVGSFVEVLTSGDPQRVAVGDLNGDSRLDIATANNPGECVAVLVNSGRRGFASTSIDLGFVPNDIVIGDLNGDGSEDIATLSSQERSLTTFLGDARGGFFEATSHHVGPTPRAISLAARPDGDASLVVASAGLNAALVFAASPDGPVLTDTVVAGSVLSAAVEADADADGVLDLIASVDGHVTVVNAASSELQLQSVPGAGEMFLSPASTARRSLAALRFDEGEVVLFDGLGGSRLGIRSRYRSLLTRCLEISMAIAAMMSLSSATTRG